MKCWAKNVSPCCNTQSGEHYITKGLFSNKLIHVRNAPFLEDANKVVSKVSLKRNCLCKKHNELLSIYDDEAIHFANSLKYCLELSQKRRRLNSKKLSVHNKFINYDKFNRWYIKTYLGLANFFRYEPIVDKDKLANIVYLDSSIRHYVYLKIGMNIGENFVIEESVSIAPLEENGKTIGMEIELYGIRLHGIFSDKPVHIQKPILINFHELKKGKSCSIKFR